MEETSALSSSRWPSYSSPPQRFHDLPTALHREVASYLHAHEALAVSATEHGLQALYPASITRVTIHPQLLSDYAQDKVLRAGDWQSYLDRHGASLARLLARLPGLTLLNDYWPQHQVVCQAIFLQPCPQLGDVEPETGDFPRDLDRRDFPKHDCPRGPSLLHLAIARGHLPSWNKLFVRSSDQCRSAVEALQAGHLTRVKELEVFSFDNEPLPLQTLLEAFKTYQGKLEAFNFMNKSPSHQATRQAIQELMLSPVCSDLRKLFAFDCASRFVTEYLMGSGVGGRPSLRYLSFLEIAPENLSSLANALLQGGDLIWRKFASSRCTLRA
jgi:hypothetical protein